MSDVSMKIAIKGGVSVYGVTGTKFPVTLYKDQWKALIRNKDQILQFLEDNKEDILIEKAARAGHEINRAYCSMIGDSSQPVWEECPAWQKVSARVGVKAIMKDPDITPERMHENWVNLKEIDGWTYGPVKDPEKKEHPCLVSYDELPVEQKAKDSIFLATVTGILAHEEEE